MFHPSEFHPVTRLSEIIFTIPLLDTNPKKVYVKMFGPNDEVLSLHVENTNIEFPPWPITYVCWSDKPFSNEMCLFPGCNQTRLYERGCHIHICPYRLDQDTWCWDLIEEGSKMCSKHK